MGTMALRKTVNHLVRCDLCQHVSHNIYKVSLGGMSYNFCSGMHAEQARLNFQKNKELNRAPSIINEIEEEEGGSNLGIAE